jgi:hypothetical protein
MAKKIFLLTIITLLFFSLNVSQSNANYSNTEIIKPGSLVKASSEAVYYVGADGNRYVFPNHKTYSTWYVNFNMVVSISDQLLADLPIAGNVTYKPGKRLIKITTDPKVYWVDKEGTLRHLASESVAKQLFGQTWYSLVDDVPDTFFINYRVGLPITTPVLPVISIAYAINNDKLLTTTPDPIESELGKINLKGNILGTSAQLNWTPYNVFVPNGFKVVMGNNPDPVYPGNEYHYLSDGSSSSDEWHHLSPGTYYFRVCQYIDGKCGIYSNNLALKVAGETTYQADKKLTVNTSLSGTAVKLNWESNFYSSKGYKVVISNNPNPVYPGNDYHYLSNPETRSDSWTNLQAGKTYHFRVCEYLDGSCGAYSNDVAVTVKDYAVIDNSNGLITLNAWYDESLGKVRLEWAVKDLYSAKGYKVVISNNPNPVYPGNDYHYLSDPNVRADKWAGLASGTYHFRVCEYLGGACGAYSNNYEITVPGPVINNANGSISLDGWYDASLGKVRLEWSVIDMYSDLGFKIVYSTSPNPVYPGNEYHYLSDPNIRTDKWAGLAPGTYHFRACEYLGGACGIYSNDTTVTVQ